MNETTTSCQDTRPHPDNRRYACLLVLSLTLLTTALGSALLQAVLGTQVVA